MSLQSNVIAIRGALPADIPIVAALMADAFYGPAPKPMAIGPWWLSPAMVGRRVQTFWLEAGLAQRFASGAFQEGLASGAAASGSTGREGGATYTCLVAESNGGLVGAVELGVEVVSPAEGSNAQSRRMPYLSSLAVHPSYRRGGIGSSLVRECEQLAVQWGFAELCLDTAESNGAARALYTAEGYVREGQTPVADLPLESLLSWNLASGRWRKAVGPGAPPPPAAGDSPADVRRLPDDTRLELRAVSHLSKMLMRQILLPMAAGYALPQLSGAITAGRGLAQQMGSVGAERTALTIATVLHAPTSQ
eukprot:CAMPEP_0206012834 /NCGR_PEP_ID=MMETSP1464-20131121/15502_1 /ASSEMBLY_ACC=CAM_ASM_001124 /TAXON_ID=119497 /ORGANISM="Exanthemachrysis gayraliae, Strain RCC1523" /LENGTH=306 /DNA_ID=CAMNT_0053386535 /DNA_START=36 /DNA_END=956 /DNA_ORIENTATION=+